MAVLAPMPSARVSTATAVNPGCLRSKRRLWRTSCASAPIRHGSQSIKMDAAVDGGDFDRGSALTEFAVEILTNGKMLFHRERESAADAAVNRAGRDVGIGFARKGDGDAAIHGLKRDRLRQP